MNSYVLITPAHNEEAYIEKTIQSIVSQTLLPKKWIIVSDGSTDDTDNIVTRHTERYAFIKLIHLPRKAKRDFSSKVCAFNAGYQRITDDEFSFIGNLDADISFDQCYYEKVVEKFESNLKLGIAGGNRYDVYDNKCEAIVRTRNSVMGAVQLFRRECYEEIGGYIPLDGGGEDAVAEIMARMHGWEVETFPEIKVYHYRRTGTANTDAHKAWFRRGEIDYLIGYHPVFELFRCLQRALRNPSHFPKSIYIYVGYCWAFLKRPERKVPREVVKYLRSEQTNRLLRAISLNKKKRDELIE